MGSFAPRVFRLVPQFLVPLVSILSSHFSRKTRISLLSRELSNAKLLDTSLKASADSQKASAESNAKLLDSSQKANAKVVSDAMRHSEQMMSTVIDRARLVAENEAMRTHRDFNASVAGGIASQGSANSSAAPHHGYR